MDSEDEKFIHSISTNVDHKAKSKSGFLSNNRKYTPIITEDKFEKLIDVLEKEAFRKIHKVSACLIIYSSLTLSFQIPSRSFLDYLGTLPKKKQANQKTNGDTLKGILPPRFVCFVSYPLR